MEEPLIESWDSALVTLSYASAVMGSYGSMLYVEGMITSKSKLSYVLHLLGAALCLGGVGIWTMHFIGMQAMDIGRTIVYDAWLTLFSLGAAILVSFLALLLMTVKANYKAPAAWRLVFGGIGAGGGVATMHYFGMLAMRIDCGMIHYLGGVVAISVIIGIVAATAALWVLVFLRGEFARMLASFIMGLAVCSMHFTGMMAASYQFDPTLLLQAEQISSAFKGDSLGLVAAVSAGLAVFLLLAILMMKGSIEERRLRSLTRHLWRHLKDLDNLPAHVVAEAKSLLSLSQLKSPKKKKIEMVAPPPMSPRKTANDGEAE